MSNVIDMTKLMDSHTIPDCHPEMDEWTHAHLMALLSDMVRMREGDDPTDINKLVMKLGSVLERYENEVDRMEEQLVQDAIDHYLKSGRNVQPSSQDSTTETLDGEDVAVLRNVNGVLAVYKRGPRGLVEIETSAFGE